MSTVSRKRHLGSDYPVPGNTKRKKVDEDTRARDDILTLSKKWQEHVDTIRASMENDEDLSGIEDSEGRNVLHRILMPQCSTENTGTLLDLVQFLCDKGVEMTRDDKGRSPLYYAAKQEDPRILFHVVDIYWVKNAHDIVEAIKGEDRKVGGLIKFVSKHVSLSTMIVSQEVTINYLDEYKELLKFLINNFNAYIKDPSGKAREESAYHVAASRGVVLFNTMVKVVTEDCLGYANFHGDSRGNTPLHILMYRIDADFTSFYEAQYKEAIGYVGKYGDIFAINKDDSTALHVMMSKVKEHFGSYDVVWNSEFRSIALLLSLENPSQYKKDKHGVNIQDIVSQHHLKKDSAELFRMSASWKNSSEDIISLLKKNHLLVSEENSRGETIFHIVCKDGWEDYSGNDAF